MLGLARVFATRCPQVGFGAVRGLQTAVSSALLHLPETKVTTLPNGLRVATEEGFGETATVAIFIGTGSRFETEQNNGVAHFLEHLSFKGTPSLTRRDLEVEIENMGGHLNAFTSREQTAYIAKVMKQDVGRALEILGDILQNSKLEESDIDAERSVILREMDEVNSNMQEFVMDKLHSVAFRSGGLQHTILGPEENIQSLKRKDLVDFVQTQYTTDRIVVVGAGAVKHEELIALTEKLLTKFPTAPPQGVSVQSEEPVFVSNDLRITNNDFPLAHIAFAVRTCGFNDPDTLTLMVMQQLLGSYDVTTGSGKNLSSPLCSRIASDNSFKCHSVMCFSTPYTDTGLFGAYLVAEHGRLDDLVHLVFTEIRKLTEVSEEEVARARNQIKASLLVDLDGSTQVTEDIGRQVLTFGRRIPMVELFARIDAIDAKQVQRVTNKYFYDKDVASVCFGPIQNLPDLGTFRRWTYSLL